MWVEEAGSFGRKKMKIASKNPLNIIIVGCGNVGTTLVGELSKEGNNVTVIDRDGESLSTITGTYDVMGFHGNGASYGLLKEAGIDDTDLFIAVTESDEMNLLCCTVAGRIKECATIARVRDPAYSRELNYLQERLGLTMIINPEFETAAEMLKILSMPAALEVNTFFKGFAEIVKIKVEPKSLLDGVTVSEFSKKTKGAVLFAAIERDGDVSIASGDFRFLAGDIVSFVAPRRGTKDRLKLLGLPNDTIHNCLIVGGSEAALYLAKSLSSSGVSVTIIEKNEKRCNELSAILPDCVIINADGTDENILREEGLLTVDAFVPQTGIDEENIILTLHAKHFSEAKVVTKINRAFFSDVIKSLDLGSVILPRIITSEAIVAYARARRASKDSNIESLYHLYDGKVEAIEFLIRNESKLTGVPLKDLRLDKGVLIALIERDGDYIFPGGNDTLKVNDSVMVVTTNFGYGDIIDILDEE